MSLCGAYLGYLENGHDEITSTIPQLLFVPGNINGVWLPIFECRGKQGSVKRWTNLNMLLDAFGEEK